MERIITEEGPAVVPGSRREFNSILDLLSEGRADAILCLDLDRLSRNAIKTYAVVQLLRDGHIKEFITREGTYVRADFEENIISEVAEQLLLSVRVSK